MLKKFLKDVVVLVVGKQAEKIVDLLDEKKYISEFIIAKKLDITINQTRNILYKLSDEGLVSSTRKKDKKKGWYTYFWKIEILRCLEFLKVILNKNIEQLSFKIRSRESKQFYICEKCMVELNEENALLRDFICNECGGLYTLKDNTKVIREMNRRLDNLKKELELVNGEIDIENEKLDKVKQKELKKLEKEKVLKKAKKSAERKKLSAQKFKETKKVLVKKTVKKKLSKKKVLKKSEKRKPIKKKVVKKKPVRKKVSKAKK